LALPLKQRDKRPSIHPIYLGETHDLQNGRHEIYSGYKILIVHIARSDLSRPAYDPGGFGAVKITVGFGKWEGHPIVAQECDYSVLSAARLVQGFKYAAHYFIAPIDRCVIFCDFLSDIRNVRQKSRDGYLFFGDPSPHFR